MSNPVISIIIPAYNAAQYLPNLLRSIFSQNFDSYEVIVIDDGSTDNTQKVLSKFIDDRLKVLFQRNRGVYAARNKGIEIASGNWLWFVDADDELLPNSLEVMASAVMVLGGGDHCKFNMIQADYITDPPKLNRPPLSLSEILDSESMLTLLFQSVDNRFWGYLWSKLFQREVISCYKLRFREGLYFNEDSLFIYEYILSIRNRFKCRILNSEVYRYFIRSSNTMAQIESLSYWKYESDLDACIIMASQMDVIKSSRLRWMIKERLYNSYSKNIQLVKKYSTEPEPQLQRLKIKAYSKLNKVMVCCIIARKTLRRIVKRLLLTFTLDRDGISRK